MAVNRHNPIRAIAEEQAQRYSGSRQPVVTLEDTGAHHRDMVESTSLNDDAGAQLWVAGVDTFDNAGKVF
jgi:hypothetical protein